MEATPKVTLEATRWQWKSYWQCDRDEVHALYGSYQTKHFRLLTAIWAISELYLGLNHDTFWGSLNLLEQLDYT